MITAIDQGGGTMQKNMDPRVARWLLQAGRDLDTAAAIGSSGILYTEEIQICREMADKAFSMALGTEVKWEEPKT